MSLISNAKQELLNELYVAFTQWRQRIIDTAQYNEWIQDIYERGILMYKELKWLNKP